MYAGTKILVHHLFGTRHVSNSGHELINKQHLQWKRHNSKNQRKICSVSSVHRLSVLKYWDMSAVLVFCPFVFLLKLFLTLEAFEILRFESLTEGLLLGVLSSTNTLYSFSSFSFPGSLTWLSLKLSSIPNLSKCDLLYIPFWFIKWRLTPFCLDNLHRRVASFSWRWVLLEWYLSTLALKVGFSLSSPWNSW